MILYRFAQIPAPCDRSTLKMLVAVLRIRITLKRIRIRMRILILSLMRIRIAQGDADPNPTFYFDADPDPHPSLQKRLKISKKCSNSLIFHTVWLDICKLLRIRIRI
jgi:hypothetical protein